MSNDSYNAAAGALRELAAAQGLHVHKIGELRRYGARCEPLLGALLNELATTTSRELVEELANVLAAPWARDAAFEPLVERFRTTPNSPPTTKAALAHALELLADDRFAPSFVELASDRRHGNARALLVLALGRIDGDGVLEALVDLLPDPGVGGHAVTALAEFVERNREPVDELLIKPYLRDGRPWVRRDAKALLQLLEKHGHRAQGGPPDRVTRPPERGGRARTPPSARRKRRR